MDQKCAKIFFTVFLSLEKSIKVRVIHNIPEKRSAFANKTNEQSELATNEAEFAHLTRAFVYMS